MTIYIYFSFSFIHYWHMELETLKLLSSIWLIAGNPEAVTNWQLCSKTGVGNFSMQHCASSL